MYLTAHKDLHSIQPPFDTRICGLPYTCQLVHKYCYSTKNDPKMVNEDKKYQYLYSNRNCFLWSPLVQQKQRTCSCIHCVYLTCTSLLFKVYTKGIVPSLHKPTTRYNKVPVYCTEVPYSGTCTCKCPCVHKIWGPVVQVVPHPETFLYRVNPAWNFGHKMQAVSDQRNHKMQF